MNNPKIKPKGDLIMEQFIKIDVNIIKEKKLTPTEIIVYSVLCDRMRSSRKRQSFFDHERNDFYAIFTLDEMSEYLNIAKGTAFSAYKKLEKTGYLIKKQTFTANRLFLPLFNNDEENTNENKNESDIAKFETSKEQNLKPNQRDINQKNINIQNKFNTSFEVSSQTTSDKDIRPIDKLANALVWNSGINRQVVEVMKDFAFGNSATLHKYAQMLFLAKKYAFKKHPGVSDDMRKFETNPKLNAGLKQSIKEIMRGAIHCPENVEGYLFTSFRNVFEDKISEFHQEINGSYNFKFDFTNKPDIPLFKIDK